MKPKLKRLRDFLKSVKKILRAISEPSWPETKSRNSLKTIFILVRLETYYV